MFSALQRFQGISSNVITAAIWISLFVALSSYAQLYLNEFRSLPAVIDHVKAVTTLKYSRGFGSRNREPKENSRIAFDLTADISDLFNWNTKQVFVYLTAEYEGQPSIPANKVTFWNKIITKKEDAVLNLQKERSSFSVWDVEDSFRQRNASLKLEWNIQPHVGLLLWGENKGSYELTFPEVKGSSSAST
ncbi:unnamed protein product [Kuraishia capsulata CBS 1993]|uniref:Signal peptidase subunit 3 n=1 Tax=Kuraishia capsulata CBS 1993 TaxID=1382522 RepID=W6MIN4_9ASCO|nr:uncharacterized protein KUCA_T00001763001 [Kuraishia capsulata CBS 1993]CDK25793.1 unnamed protein product [Kuraishia capsulata CBS 1993]